MDSAVNLHYLSEPPDFSRGELSDISYVPGGSSSNVLYPQQGQVYFIQPPILYLNSLSICSRS